MVIVDKALEKRKAEGNPIRVGMVGAGFMARGIALQILRYVPGMSLVAIANRHPDKATKAYHEAGIGTVRLVETEIQLEDAIRRGQHAITEDPLLLARAGGIVR
jgi:predicted homoserine dehydrogenase-like protein